MIARSRLTFAFAVIVAGAMLAAQVPAAVSFLPVDEVRPGMVGVGRTVFQGDTLEEFRVDIVGVLRNVMGPQRDLVLARLDGGPLANAGVIEGMSGSPVYVDGRLLGAVSYSIGSFPKEALAGITPIGEMTAAVRSDAPRPNVHDLSLVWPATPTDVYDALGRLARRASAPLGTVPGDLRVIGAPSLAELAPTVRPIGAALVLGGFDPGVASDLQRALAPAAAPAQTTHPAPDPSADATLRPGDPIGISLIRGDLESGATGTVTYVDGSRVYAFGHPFLGLGPTSFAMTKAHVYTILPSLDASMKIASLGPVVGTLTQDRATAIGGTLGPGPRELAVHLSIVSDGDVAKHFTFYVIRDQTLTPLFTFAAIQSALTSFERQAGVLSIAAKGTLSFGTDGRVAIDDVFTGDTAINATAAAIAAPIGQAVANDFRVVMPEDLTLDLRTSERQESTTITRAWLDTIHPRLGQTYTLQVELQDYRGARHTVAIPVTMPTEADGTLTMLVSDAATLTTLEQHELKPAKAANWPALLADLNAARRGNRIYVRLISTSTGAVVGGDTLSALPASVRAAFDTDSSTARTSIAKTVVGAWEDRLDVAVHGSRELPLTLEPPE